MQKIIVDSDIPYIRGVFEPYCRVEYLKGEDITKDTISGAEGLIVRTRTRCDRELLQGSDTRVIATATIGVDHIDLRWCRESGVEVFSAQGSNSRAVAQWVFSAIMELRNRGVVRDGYRLGVIGVGSVGAEVVEMARVEEGLGVGEVLLNDPPRKERGMEGGEGGGRGGKGVFRDIDEVLRECDVVTLHIPLDKGTRGMVDEDFLAKMRPGAVLLNSSRGEVISADAVLANRQFFYVFDVWPNEPNVDVRLVDLCELATPHIAGYSMRGKARATTMVVRQLSSFFGISELMDWDCSLGMGVEGPFGCDVSFYDGLFRSDVVSFEFFRIIRG